MNSKNLFSFVAFVSVLFGLGLVFAPEFMASQYLTNPAWMNEAALLLAQGWGVSLIAIGLACWYVRQEGPTLGRRAMLLLLVTLNIGFLIIYLMAIVNRVETPLAWLQVLLAVVVGGWAAALLRQSERVRA